MEALGAEKSGLDRSWKPLGRLLRDLSSILKSLGVLLEAPGACTGDSLYRTIQPPWRLYRGFPVQWSGSLLEASWTPLERSFIDLEISWSALGSSRRLYRGFPVQDNLAPLAPVQGIPCTAKEFSNTLAKTCSPCTGDSLYSAGIHGRWIEPV